MKINIYTHNLVEQKSFPARYDDLAIGAVMCLAAFVKCRYLTVRSNYAYWCFLFV